MKSFDLISDLHLDFYVRDYWDWDKEVTPTAAQIIQAFAESIIPDSPSSVLVIAGDLGHKNSHSQLLLTFLAKKYDHVLFTNGNHDLYLFPNEKEHVIYNRSIERWQELKEMASEIPGVTVLDGNKVTINDVTFGGTSLWYDYTFGLKLGYSWKKLDAYWFSHFNDSNYITECPDFAEEMKKLDAIFDSCDVVITHVSPDDSRVNPRYRVDPMTSFYYFDGSEFLSRAKGKVWCFGHVHYRQMYINRGCLLVNNALGYPGELPFVKAMRVPLDKHDYYYGVTDDVENKE
ncbi:hypothetical protein FHR92_003769 [Fontibacillus solani]|uniref:Calcineurin-like phosphoesterase domain-containing protein n=1 Tax=Fontibacillus solani TaxID=1572857 RepID=A0A7W3SW09_9BACL|nr:metallophosphoesterase [Fontibacillus solani]MBA9087285.1 hypothetical protein [Fontibacillus solani]